MACLRQMVFAAAALGWGCGSAGPATPVHAPAEAAAPERRSAPSSELSTSAEVGGLDEQAAEQSFRASMGGLEACIRDGAQRLEFIGGSIEFAVKVDATRQAARVWAAQSSLGERSTEKCMFDALRSVTWPAPEGGPFGIARNSFDFELRRGTAVPAIWDAGRVATVVSELDSTLSRCRGDEPERLLITLYIGPEGKALGGGAASAQPVDDQSVDCVVEALLAAEYPVPEHSPTKVRFQL